MLTVHKKLFLLPFIISLLSLYLYSCSTDYAAKTPPTVDLAVKKKNDRLNEVLIVSSATLTKTVDDYRIGPEDLLEIEAYNVEELKKTVRVNSRGDIALPLVGVIGAKGMTTSELEKIITEKLEKYVQETVVNVFVKEYHSQRISVVGAVNNPQIYAVTGQRYLIDMLMTAGGLQENAGNTCYVIRPSANDSTDRNPQTIIIDLNELLINGNFNLNIPVFVGDVINVPKGGVVFVDGAVRNPGAFAMKGKMTFMQAITMAKGVSQNAKQSDVRIFRDNGNGDRDVIKVDYNAIRKGKDPDIFIAENDIIIVPTSGFKSFFYSIRGLFSIGSGYMGVGM